MTPTRPNFQTVYPTISKLFDNAEEIYSGEYSLSKSLAVETLNPGAPPYLCDLARVEEAIHVIRTSKLPAVSDLDDDRIINPSLQLLNVQWSGLPDLINNIDSIPKPAEEYVLAWKTADNSVHVSRANSHDLLALKIVSEEISSRKAAEEGNVTVGSIDDILYLAAQKEIILTPGSKIVRPADFPRGVRGEGIDPAFLTAPTFTLQWHITQTCDLHCRHCYDRSSRTELELDEGIRILDQLYDFCRDHHVYTQVSFSGGNPLLYPHFNQLYREAADRGFLTAILGNPAPKHRLEELTAIQKPEFFQVSLEGLRAHNDYMRGAGHFDRTLEFLDLLQDLGIYSMVMLTLTRANIDEVVSLADQLRDRVDLFTFNRLAMVGEGAVLASVETERYPEFLRSYVAAGQDNPVIGYKDNLLNIIRHAGNDPCFGGCAGYGCGAAFNFVSLLPDGEIHACRKFPSLIGSLNDASLDAIYYSEKARQYRRGSRACSSCSIRPVCGGCMAVGYGFGIDIFNELDPYCFMETVSSRK